MTKIELFEPAMCCPTGLCGPSIDKNLVMISAAFNELRKQPNIKAIRYNLSQNAAIFTYRPEVLNAMKDKTTLPITEVNGKIVKTGAYPTISELSKYTGYVFPTGN